MANGQSHIHDECLNLKLSVVKRQGTSSHPDHFFSQQSNPGWNVSGTAIHVRVARNLPIKAAAFYPEAGWTQWKALNITDMPFHVSEAVAWHISKLKKMHLWWQLVRSLYLKLYNLFNNYDHLKNTLPQGRKDTHHSIWHAWRNNIHHHQNSQIS